MAADKSGLYGKYMVIKVVDGTVIEDCFILRPEKDPAAVKAMQAYAAATDDKELADAIYKWVGMPNGQTLEQVVRERDQLMDDLKSLVACEYCKYKDCMQGVCDENDYFCPTCEGSGKCPCFSCTDKAGNNHWIWRGLPDQKGSDPS